MSVVFGHAEPPADPSEKAPWHLLAVGPNWWLEREVIALERQVGAGEGLFHQFCKRRLERLGPFESLVDARGYLDAMEGK